MARSKSPAARARAAPENKYSVLLPTYNEAVNLPLMVGLLDDVFTKAALAFEIIVVEDSSPDGTYEVALALQKVRRGGSRARGLRARAAARRAADRTARKRITAFNPPPRARRSLATTSSRSSSGRASSASARRTLTG